MNRFNPANDNVVIYSLEVAVLQILGLPLVLMSATRWVGGRVGLELDPGGHYKLRRLCIELDMTKVRECILERSCFSEPLDFRRAFFIFILQQCQKENKNEVKKARRN